MQPISPPSSWAADPRQPTSPTAALTADQPGWQTTGVELIYDGAHAKVFHETVITPSRPEGVTWTVVRRKAAVVIAPQTVDGRWLLIRQERLPIRRVIWEFPAGQIEAGEGPYEDRVRNTVWRELREESGHCPGPDTDLVPLGVFFPSSGFTDEHSHLFHATQLVPHQDGALPDAAESIIECRAFSTDELVAMIGSGEIRDANTLAAFARLTAQGRLRL